MVEYRLIVECPRCGIKIGIRSEKVEGRCRICGTYIKVEGDKVETRYP